MATVGEAQFIIQVDTSPFQAAAREIERVIRESVNDAWDVIAAWSEQLGVEFKYDTATLRQAEAIRNVTVWHGRPVPSWQMACYMALGRQAARDACRRHHGETAPDR